MKVEAALQIPIADIEVASQVRQFSWGDIEELARMIASHGFCQPVVLKRAPAGAARPYVLIAGERRIRAVRDHLKWETIPAVIAKGKDSWTLQLQENLGRSDLHWLEIAHATEQWIADGITLEEIARTMGQSSNRARSMLRAYRGLHPSNRDWLMHGRHRPPLERALIWVAWAQKPERQREEIEQWLGLAKTPKPRAKGKKREGPIPRQTVEKLLARAINRRANALVLTTLRYLLGEVTSDPFRVRKNRYQLQAAELPEEPPPS